MTLSLTTVCHYAKCCLLFFLMLNVIMLGAFKLDVAMLNVLKLNVAMRSVVRMNVAMLNDVK